MAWKNHLMIFIIVLSYPGSILTQTSNKHGFKVDVCFTLSRSFTIDAVKWQQMLDFVVQMSEQVELSDDAFWMGVVTFGTFGEHVAISSDYHDDLPAFQEEIRNIDYYAAGNNLAAGLETTRTECLDIGRPDAQDIVLLLTDSSFEPHSAYSEATKLREAGARVIVLGVGDNVDAKLLQTLSNGANNYFQIADFAGLVVNIDNVLGIVGVNETGCSRGYFGANCASRCGQCADSSGQSNVCDREGRCLNGCQLWWIPPNCSPEIEKPIYKNEKMELSNATSNSLEIIIDKVLTPVGLSQYYGYRVRYKNKARKEMTMNEPQTDGRGQLIITLRDLLPDTEYTIDVTPYRVMDGKYEYSNSGYETLTAQTVSSHQPDPHESSPPPFKVSSLQPDPAESSPPPLKEVDLSYIYVAAGVAGIIVVIIITIFIVREKRMKKSLQKTITETAASTPTSGGKNSRMFNKTCCVEGVGYYKISEHREDSVSSDGHYDTLDLDDMVDNDGYNHIPDHTTQNNSHAYQEIGDVCVILDRSIDNDYLTPCTRGPYQNIGNLCDVIEGGSSDVDGYLLPVTRKNIYFNT